MGFWAAELTHPWYELTERGVDVTIASPDGGRWSSTPCPIPGTLFLAVLPCLVATWALGGLYLSLGPSIAYSLPHSSNRLLGSAVIASLAGAGGLAALAVNRWPPLRAMRAGCVALILGDLLAVAGTALHEPIGFLLGSFVAGRSGTGCSSPCSPPWPWSGPGS